MPDPTAPDDPTDPFAGFELISVYTRQNAIDDQVLFDITDAARASGFKIPVAATAAVYAYLDPSPELIAAGHSLAERTRLLLDVLYFAASVYPDSEEVRFKLLLVLAPGCPPEPVPLKALCHPGDDGSPVLTILLPQED
jgi:hypothetical protein